ncbi:MAG: carbohydrate kinase family protein [Burkholderiaceae bacterium]|nr:MAG: carbohydrate kinase family protein [Burkholderiaceae bacterium]
MRALICGSIAYDNIMVFEGHFKDHILPEQVHILNVSFLVPALRREYGGTGANIAYNLGLLGGQPVLMTTLGMDGADYRQRLYDQELDTQHLRIVPGAYTAQAFITTDMSDNQITAFHPGAMNSSHMNRVGDASDIGIGIVAPDGKRGMMEHAAQFHEKRIPFIFDPGQGLPMFDRTELLTFIAQADYITVNDYEARMLSERVGLSLEQIAHQVKALIVTLGGKGSHIYTDGKVIEIPCAQPSAMVDPTGCGDAYRAGLLYGLSEGMDWETTGRLASLMGAIKIAHQGAQNHTPKRDEIGNRFANNFGYKIW